MLRLGEWSKIGSNCLKARPSIRWLVLIFASFTFAATSCGSTSGPSKAAPPVFANRPFDSIDPIADLAKHNLSSPDYSNAIETATAQCMTAKGWHYEPAIKSEELFYGPGDGPTNPTALVAYRQRYGYGYLNPSPQPVDTTRAVVDRRGAYLASLDPIRRKAYLADLGADSSSGGTGATSSLSGCLGDAETSVRRTRPVTPDSIVDDLASKQAGALQDPAYLAASSRWVACMDGKGFHFRRPADAQASISDLFAAPPGQTAASRGPDSQALEIRTATADAQCSLDTVWPVQAKLYDNLIDQSIEKYGREAVCGEAC